MEKYHYGNSPASYPGVPDGTVVDATADQFEERWRGDVAVLPPGDPRYANYRPAPPGHRFRTVLAGGRRRLLARRGAPDGELEPEEQVLATAPDTGAGWAALGARAVEAHSDWRLLNWIGREAEAAGQALPSRELEFALDAARQRRIGGRGEWTSPEWRESREARASG